MYFLMSGEGPTDLGDGVNNDSICEGIDFRQGPMAMFVDQIVQQRLQYSIFSVGCCGFVSKSCLVQEAAKLKRRKKSQRLPGKKSKKETGYFERNARCLANIAQKKAREIGDSVIAVLFRDSDGTASADRGLWQDKFDSVLRGFEAEHFNKGVPMLPKPKSETWLLCALKNDYQNCAKLENRSGNDSSPRSLKKDLETILQNLDAQSTRESLCCLVRSRTIDVTKINMPSFNAFRDRLEKVLDCK